MAPWLTYYFSMPAHQVAKFADAGVHIDALISFAHFCSNLEKKEPSALLKALRGKGKKFMLDSGAFTNLSHPGRVTLEQYKEYLKSDAKHWDEYITLDDMNSRDVTIKQHEQLRKMGLSPLFVDHIRLKDDPRVGRYWKSDDKICLSAWAISGTGSAKGPSGKIVRENDVPKALAARVDLGRKLKTKMHLLAVSSLTKFLPHLDVVDSVDSATWGRAPGFGKLLVKETKDFGGIKLPILRAYDSPEKKGADRPMTKEARGVFRSFTSKRWDGLGRRRVIELFCITQTQEYVKELNAMKPSQLQEAFARHKTQKEDEARATRKTYFDLDLDDTAIADAWEDSSIAGREGRYGEVSVSEITTKTLRTMPDLQLLGIHERMHLAVEKTEEGASLAEAHLFVLQEMTRRGMPCGGADLLDFETARIAKSAGLVAAELAALGLVEVQKQMVMQTLILSKETFETKEEATTWVRDHNFSVKPGAPDETGDSWRFRQREPGEFVATTFRTIDITDGVKGVVGRLKEEQRQKAADLFFADEDEDDETKEVSLLPLTKAEEDRRIVFGVVLEPASVDTQGDTISSEEIERAAHLWLARFQDRGFMHRRIVNGQLEIYESYLAPTDLTIGGQKVKKGSWLLMYHVKDDALWAAIKRGELTGFSMGGFARRQQV